MLFQSFIGRKSKIILPTFTIMFFKRDFIFFMRTVARQSNSCSKIFLKIYDFYLKYIIKYISLV